MTLGNAATNRIFFSDFMIQTKVQSKSFFAATALITGTALGAGIFGLPYAFAQSGYWIGVAYLALFGVVSIILIKAYAEVVLRTPERSQIIGYAKRYLGNRGRIVALASFLFGITGALIAYTLQVGRFLETVFRPYVGGSAFWYGLGFFAVGSLIVLIGLRAVAKFEKYLLILLGAVALVIIGSGTHELDWSNLSVVHPENFFWPYGVVLFALSAASAIPDAVDELQEKKKIFRAITIGMLIPLALYFLFTLIVVGVTGAATTQDAITGLTQPLGGGIVVAGSILGIMTMSTAFLSLGLVIKEIYNYDLGLPMGWAWLVAFLPPLVVYLFQLTSFIQIVALVGGVMGGFDGILILMMWRKAKKLGRRKPERVLHLPRPIQYAMMAMFGLGIVYEVYFQIFRG